MDDCVGAYLLVLSVPGHRLAPGMFAIESAFAHHLRQLRQGLGKLGRRMVLSAPSMSEAEYEAQKSWLSVIDESREGIYFHALFPGDASHLAYLVRLPRVLWGLYGEVRQASIVHAGNSRLYRPFEFPALLLGWGLGKKTISVTDIDSRQSAVMNYRSGRWSRKEYIITRLLHDPHAHLQQALGTRLFSLVLVKGKKLAADYGRGRSNVRSFLDAAFGHEHIIPPQRLEAKLRALADPERPIELAFFGRLVDYKGVDHMLRALRRALELGASRFRFHILGAGPERPRLTALAGELGLDDHVLFHGAVPFGDALFARLCRYHVLLAAPLSEDTPRSALDALASGQALVAYDTYYYRELADAGAPIELVPWLDVDALGDAILRLGRERERLAALLRRAVEFAVRNTQEEWLDRRVRWTRELFEAPRGGEELARKPRRWLSRSTSGRA